MDYVAMEFALATEQSLLWTATIEKQATSDWLDELLPHIPRPIQELFGQDQLPSISELVMLPWSSDHRGLYCDGLRDFFGKESDLNRIRVGCTFRAHLETRKKQHNNRTEVFAVRSNHQNSYYQAKYSGDNPVSSRFVTLSAIKIPHFESWLEQSRLRMFCRVAEAFWAFWLGIFDKSPRMCEPSRQLHVILYGYDNDGEEYMP